MSMNAYARPVSPFEIAALKRNPAAARSMVSTGTLGRLRPGVPNLLKNIGLLREGGGRGVLASPAPQRELQRQVEEANAPIPAADPARVLDLHKSWHVLHYLFTGEAEGGIPPANALLGGREIGDDMGYGPPRLHEPAAAAAFARFLAPLTVAELQARLDLPRMRERGVYSCEDDGAASADELRGDIAHDFPRLQAFVADAAANGNGLLFWLS